MNISHVVGVMVLWCSILFAQSEVTANDATLERLSARAISGGAFVGAGIGVRYGAVLPAKIRILEERRKVEMNMSLTESQYGTKKERLHSESSLAGYGSVFTEGVQIYGVVRTAVANTRAARLYTEATGDNGRYCFAWIPALSGISLKIISGAVVLMDSEGVTEYNDYNGRQESADRNRVKITPLVIGLVGDLALVGASVHAVIMTSRISRAGIRYPDPGLSVSVNPIILKNGGGAQVAVRF